MLDLIVCVGESCHINGAEVVLKSLRSIIKRENLEDKVVLKGSFCIGKCSDKSKVSVRLGDHLFQISNEDSAEVFTTEILPLINASAGSGNAS